MMAPKTQVWRNETDGKYYHDICFEEGEGRDGFMGVKLDDLEDDATCETCGGTFLIGITSSGMTDEDDDDDDC